jgi:hypothetical protein
VHGLFDLLTAANLPVDFLDEDAVGSDPARLETFKVVFVTAPNLPLVAMAALRSYASMGGTVVLCRGAALMDRYGTPPTTGGVAPGVEVGMPTPTVVPNIWTLPLTTNGTITQGGAPFSAFGPRGHAAGQLPTNTTVLARFTDGSPAAVRTQLGAGSILRLLWFPGMQRGGCFWHTSLHSRIAVWLHDVAGG